MQGAIAANARTALEALNGVASAFTCREWSGSSINYMLCQRVS